MMRRLSLILFLAGLIMMLAIGASGCKNPDNSTNPKPPGPIGPGATGDPMDPNIPEPFAYPISPILDIGLEGDGDVALCTVDGIMLFSPYGVFKRFLTSATAVGIATSNQGQVDTGRGVMFIGPDTDCIPTPAFDDLYVQGGVPHVSYYAPWWEGNADPYYPLDCFTESATSDFESCDGPIPFPISYHPQTAFVYQKVYTPNCIADDTCQWPYGNTVPIEAYGILCYHPDTPLPASYFPPFLWVGGEDFLVHYDFPTYRRTQQYAALLGVVPACQNHNLFIVWDWTSPTLMSSRSGMVAAEISDFEFDSLNRLIIAMRNADSVAITDPCIFNQPISIQEVLGGRQNGMGTLPGEFQGPTAVAIDPRNQNILVSDTGNGRVQIFDNDGNFIREFGGADRNFAPGAIRVDSFGAIYVANVSPNRAEGDNLRIYNEYGAPVTYGTLEGYVRNKQAPHNPIDNVRVRVMSTFRPLDVLTNEEGRFIFPAVAAGTHNVVADKYGYTSTQVVAKVTGGYKTVVDIYLDRQQTEPPGYGIITGTVFSSLYNEPVVGLTAQIAGSPISTVTNGNGEFTLYNVPTGDRLVQLTSGGIIYYETLVTVTQGQPYDLGLLVLPIP